MRTLLPALPVLAALILAGCTRTVYVPVENTSHTTDTVRLVNLRTDSVVQRDSVAVYVNGDTVRITRWRDRFRYRDRTDTVYKAVTASVKVSVPYPVERKLTKWERTKLDWGGKAMGLIAAAVCAATAWLALRAWIRSKVPKT